MKRYFYLIHCHLQNNSILFLSTQMRVIKKKSISDKYQQSWISIIADWKTMTCDWVNSPTWPKFNRDVGGWDSIHLWSSGSWKVWVLTPAIPVSNDPWGLLTIETRVLTISVHDLVILQLLAAIDGSCTISQRLIELNWEMKWGSITLLIFMKMVE